jgi:hypothetical protein
MNGVVPPLLHMTCMHGELLLRFICGKDNTGEEHVFEGWVTCCLFVKSVPQISMD